jgi:branched-chain amino acid transport system substrate-binding protein
MRSSLLWLTRVLVVLAAGILLAPNLSAQSLLNDPDWVELHLQTEATGEEAVASEFSVFSEQGTSASPDFLTPLHPEFEQPVASTNPRLQLTPQVRELLMLMKDDPVEAQQQLGLLESRLKMEDRALLRIVLLLNLQRPRTAKVLAESFLRELPDDPRTPLVHLLRNRAHLALGKAIALDGRLEEQVLRTLPARYQQELLEALSVDADARKLPLASLSYRLDLLANPETASASTEQQVLEQLRQINSLTQLEVISELHGTVSVVRAWVPELYVELLRKQDQHARALELLSQFLASAREHEDAEQVRRLEGLQIRMQSATRTRPYRIGVILPLSTTNRRVVQLVRETIDGLRLALIAEQEGRLPRVRMAQPELLDFEELERSGALATLTEVTPADNASLPWQLVFRDSKLNPDHTRKMIQELVEQEQVAAIIGPLTRRTSEAAAEEAQRFGVPLISLTLTRSVPDIGEFVFRNNLSWEQEIQTLLQHAVDYHQARRFLILYADNRQGREKMRLFWEEADRLGLEIHGAEPFSSQQKSFVSSFDAFTRKLRPLTPEQEETLKELDEDLEPEHPFDALFVASGSLSIRSLQIVFPYLEVYGMQDTLLLGDSGWHDYALLFATGRRGLRKLVIAADFHRESERPEVREFMALYERMFFFAATKQRPGNYTTYAYDTAGLLMNLLRVELNQNPAALKEALLSLSGYPGVTGEFRFAENGEVQRKMRLLRPRGVSFQALN